MRKILFGLFGFILKLVGLIVLLLLVSEFVSDEKFELTHIVVFCISILASFILGNWFSTISSSLCLCGGRKNAIDADYLGHDFEHTSYDNSYVKREVKKYRITYECDKCGKISYKTQKKDGTVERHTFK